MKENQRQILHSQNRPSNGYQHPTPVLQDDELVRASKGLATATDGDDDDDDEYAITGRVLRGIMKLINLDFVYVFQGKQQLDPIKLKESLGKVLNHYPTLAGRMETETTTVTGQHQQQQQRVHLNNKGAAFRVQSTTKSIREMMMMTTISRDEQQLPQNHQEEEPPIGLYCFIPIPGEQLEGKAPLLTVTLTQFQQDDDDGGCGGCGSTLGVVMNHLVADAWTFAMFMKDWSEIFNNNDTINDTNNGSLAEPVIHHIPDVVVEKYETQEEADKAAEELGNVRSPWITQMILKLFLERLIPLGMKGKDPRLGQIPNRMKLHYTDQQLRTIKSNAEEKAGTWISTNEALMAHVWKLLLRAANLLSLDDDDPTSSSSSSSSKFLGVSYTANLRDKFPGVSHRVAGNVIATPAFSIEIMKRSKKDDDETDEDGTTSFERRIHDQMRLGLKLENLSKHHKITNRNWVVDKDSHTPFVNYQSRMAGDLNFGGNPGCLQWNSQATNPYFDISFDGGRPVRGIPWDWNQPVTVLPGIDGGVDVYIDKTGRGPISWKDTRSKKWSTTCRVLGMVTGVSGCLGLFKSQYRYDSMSSSPSWWFWLASTTSLCSGILWANLRPYAERDVEKSKQAFFEYVGANAHRFIEP
jgi:hypothetical protein